MKHTGGNPLFIETASSLVVQTNQRQFLKTSVQHGLIFFNFEDAKWDWAEEKISKLEVSENIVEYIIQNTLRGSLQQDTVDILKFAACLGTRNFNTFVLSKVLELPPSEVALSFVFTIIDIVLRSLSVCGLLLFRD
jgi:predicted ATPase